VEDSSSLGCCVVSEEYFLPEGLHERSLILMSCKSTVMCSLFCVCELINILYAKGKAAVNMWKILGIITLCLVKPDVWTCVFTCVCVCVCVCGIKSL
jgi:hypothetical protein